MRERIDGIFPKDSQIPSAFGLSQPIEQREYLVNSEIRRTLVAAKSTDMNKLIISTIVRERQSNFLSTGFIL